MLRNYQEMSGIMLKIGQFNQLTVSDVFPFGFYLGGSDQEKVLLTTADAPKDCKPGDVLNVFVYHDSDDRLVATLDTPKVQVNQVAFLKVKQIAKVGAFMDWGLKKDLLVPFSEQDKPMDEGVGYVVYVFQDEETGRLAGSTILHDFLQEKSVYFEPRQEVKLMIYGRTDMGYKAVINDTHLGLIFKDEVIKPLRIGQKTTGFIKRIRDDEKIDLCFQFHDDNARKDLASRILEDLEAHGGFSTLTDKSPPAEISQRFDVSKGAYKKALGALFKQKKILLEKTKITLVK